MHGIALNETWGYNHCTEPSLLRGSQGGPPAGAADSLQCPVKFLAMPQEILLCSMGTHTLGTTVLLTFLEISFMEYKGTAQWNILWTAQSGLCGLTLVFAVNSLGGHKKVTPSQPQFPNCSMGEIIIISQDCCNEYIQITHMKFLALPKMC